MNLLFQVFLNLGLNAVEAMAGKGRLVVESAAREGEIFVTFRDTGPGMTAEVQAHLFRPFFTARERGTGLGLSISHRIVQSHSRWIEVQSQEGEGTTFVVSLPLRERRPRMEAQEVETSWRLRS